MRTLLQIRQRKKRLLLSLKKPNRFGACVTEEQHSIAAKGVVPVNTKVANDWALRNLQQWMDHSGTVEKSKCQTICYSARMLTLSAGGCAFLFRRQGRKMGKSIHAPSTIRALLAAFQRQMMTNKVGFSLLDKADHRFRDLHNTLDTLCVLLRKKGIGAIKKHAAVICPDDEMMRSKCGRVEF